MEALNLYLVQSSAFTGDTAIITAIAAVVAAVLGFIFLKKRPKK